MSSFKLTGKLVKVTETLQVSEKFQKRDFRVDDTESMYPQTIEFQLEQDKCSLLDGFKEGETVEVSFNLKGRLWTNPQGVEKCFNSLSAWRIDRVEKAEYKVPMATPTETPKVSTGEQEDDLPF